MNYKNLLENKYDIQKIIYLLEFEKDLLEEEIVSIELADDNDFNRLERYLQLSTIYRVSIRRRHMTGKERKIALIETASYAILKMTNSRPIMAQPLRLLHKKEVPYGTS